MNSEPTLAEAQTRIDEIQQLYREWMQWLPKLEAAQSDWQHAAALMQKLSQFYFGGEYNRYYNALANGLATAARSLPSAKCVWALLPVVMPTVIRAMRRRGRRFWSTARERGRLAGYPWICWPAT